MSDAVNAGAPLVMVVDDDVAIRDAIAEALEDHGYRCVTAQNGQDAWTKLQATAVSGAEVPALILLDMMMPVMDGEAFRAKQRSDPRLAAIPVVVMTAQPQAREAIERTGQPAIGKPLTLQVLLTAVRARTGR